MANCSISVILPVYNGASFLKEAIDSILAQTFEDFELIIVNDGSTDASEEIVFSIEDNRIVYIKNEFNIGIVGSLNKAIEVAKGKYIARMDADDVSYPIRFQIQLDYLEANLEVGICSSVLKVLGKNEIIKYPEIHEDISFEFLVRNAIAHPAVMFRKALYDFYQFKYSEDFFPAEDYKLWTQFAGVCKLYNFQFPFLEYNIHPSSISQSKKEIQIDKVNEIRVIYLFQSLHMDGENRIDLMKKLFSLDLYPTQDEIYEIKKLFVLFANKNSAYKRFNKKKFKTYLSFYWYIACKHSKASLKYKLPLYVSIRSSGLTDFYFLSKLLLHSILKKR